MHCGLGVPMLFSHHSTINAALRQCLTSTPQLLAREGHTTSTAPPQPARRGGGLPVLILTCTAPKQYQADPVDGKL